MNSTIIKLKEKVVMAAKKAPASSNQVDVIKHSNGSEEYLEDVSCDTWTRNYINYWIALYFRTLIFEKLSYKKLEYYVYQPSETFAVTHIPVSQLPSTITVCDGGRPMWFVMWCDNSWSWSKKASSRRYIQALIWRKLLYGWHRLESEQNFGYR